jgi:drug/metabolite transporter (DMT)-like permease
MSFGVLLYSLGPVLVAASSASGPVFSFWRLWLGVPLLGVATALGLRSGGRRPTLHSLRWPLAAGLAFGAHQVLFMTAIKVTSVADVSLMGTLSPLLVTVAAVPLFGERPGAAFRAWTLVAISGAAIVVVGAAGGPEGNPLGMALAVANVLGFVGFFLVSKLSRDEMDVLPFLLGTMTVAAVAVSVFAVASGQPLGAVTRSDLLLALAVAAGPGAVGHFVMTWPLRWVPANVPPVLKLVQPILSGGLALVLLGQPVTGAHLGGGLVTLAGVCGALLWAGSHGSELGGAPSAPAVTSAVASPGAPPGAHQPPLNRVGRPVRPQPPAGDPVPRR